MSGNTVQTSAREQVEAIRERLSLAPMDLAGLKEELTHCCWGPITAWRWPIDYEAIELWARLAADIAAMIQSKEKA